MILEQPSKNKEIPWFDDYLPSVGIAKKNGKGGKFIYRLRFKLPTGQERYPKAGDAIPLGICKEWAHRLSY